MADIVQYMNLLHCNSTDFSLTSCGRNDGLSLKKEEGRGAAATPPLFPPHPFPS